MYGNPLPFYTDIVVALLNEIDALLNNFVYNGYAALSNYLTAPAAVIASIAVVFFGVSTTMGWVQMSRGEFTKLVFKIALIFAAVTQWSFVSSFFVDLLNSAINGLGDALISASPVHIPGADGVDGALQIVLIQFTQLGAKLFDAGGFSNLGGIFDGIVVWGFGYAIVGLALCEIILAKVMLSVLLTFIPLMALFCYFKPFQTIFDKWLGAIMGFALMQLFVTATLGLALSIAYWWLAAHVTESVLHIGNYGTLPVIIIGILCLVLIFKAAALAQNLGGIMSASSGSAMMGAMVGGFVGAGFTAAKAAGNITKNGLQGVMNLLSRNQGHGPNIKGGQDFASGRTDSEETQSQSRADLRQGE